MGTEGVGVRKGTDNGIEVLCNPSFNMLLILFIVRGGDCWLLLVLGL